LADAVLAVIAMSLEMDVWARDADFNNIQRVLTTLKLYQQP
jgi:hypothetical protein